MPISTTLDELTKLDFTGKGEAFVESNFLTPLLTCLGYDSHKDYEVIRHGDDNSSFKLRYPPVEKGSQKIRHYNPDYIPTIRKKMFWVIEAKSASEPYPFEYKSIVQGLQYSIHPEIQALYLVVSNGKHTSVYNPHSAVFFGQDIYQSKLDFDNGQIKEKWEEIHSLLSAERMRVHLEETLFQFYEKLAYSSLDPGYPEYLHKKIGIDRHKISAGIRTHVNKLYAEESDRVYCEYQEQLRNMDYKGLFAHMELPPCRGTAEGVHFASKALQQLDPKEIFEMLTQDWEKQSIFRKEQTYVALCTLHQKSPEAYIRAFLDQHKDGDLNLLNQVECIFLRIFRKLLTIKVYPLLRQRIDEYLKTAPELERFVYKPTSLKETLELELRLHDEFFQLLLKLDEKQLTDIRDRFEKLEGVVENDYAETRKNLSSSDIQIGGYEQYGLNRKHYAFANIMRNMKVL